MNQTLKLPGTMVDLRHVAADDANGLSLLIKTEQVRVSLVRVPAGQSIPTHQAEGEIILCGQVAVKALGETCELQAGQLLYLAINEPFSTRGIQDAALLMTIIQPKQGANAVLIGD